MNSIIGMIDHTLLKPDAKRSEVETLCREAIIYGCATVCVNSCHVALCAGLLKGSRVKVCTVVGFPLGAMAIRAKACEAAQAVEDGAEEIDMVINIGALREGDDDLVRRDIAAVVAASKPAMVKVILETCLLTVDEKILACRLCQEAGADFVKTSTGFSKHGATLADVALMRKTVGDNMGVKAAGGIRDYKTARAMVAAGADRIGASATAAIREQELEEEPLT